MGKKSRRKKVAKQIIPVNKKKSSPPLLTMQPNQSSIFKSKLRGAFLFIGALILGIGVPEMITGHGYAPFLIAFGALLASLVIVTDDDIQHWITHLIHSKRIRITIYITACLVFTLGSFILSLQYSDGRRDILSRTPIFYGELTPSNEPTPLSPSYELLDIPGEPPDTFRVMLGDDSGIYINGTVNNTLCLMDEPFITIRTASDGTVILNTKVFDSNNHNIVRIIDNEFQANPEYAFNPRQPDKHSLIVRDSEGVVVLNVRYINPKTIWIAGKFYLERTSQFVTISPSGLIEFDELAKQGVHMRNIYLVGVPPDIEIYLGYEVIK